MGFLSGSASPTLAQSNSTGIGRNQDVNAFGSSVTGINKDSLGNPYEVNDFSFSQPLQSEFNNSNNLINNNASYLSQSPSQQYATLQAGGNPYYNALNSQSQLNYQNSLGQAINQANLNGLTNSSTYGNTLGNLAANQQNIMNQNAVSALNQGQTYAGQNLQLGQGLQSALYGYANPMQTQTGNTMQNLLQEQDQNQQFNAQEQTQASEQNAQLQAQGLGSLAALGGTLGLAPATGGLGGFAGLGSWFGTGASVGAAPSLMSYGNLSGSLGSGGALGG